MKMYLLIVNSHLATNSQFLIKSFFFLLYLRFLYFPFISLSNQAARFCARVYGAGPCFPLHHSLGLPRLSASGFALLSGLAGSFRSPASPRSDSAPHCAASLPFLSSCCPGYNSPARNRTGDRKAVMSQMIRNPIPKCFPLPLKHLLQDLCLALGLTSWGFSDTNTVEYSVILG